MAKNNTLERREFLKGAAAAGGVVALGMVSGHAAAGSEPVRAAKPVAKGYHETQHIRDYYKSARS